MFAHLGEHSHFIQIIHASAPLETMVK